MTEKDISACIAGDMVRAWSMKGIFEYNWVFLDCVVFQFIDKLLSTKTNSQ